MGVYNMLHDLNTGDYVVYMTDRGEYLAKIKSLEAATSSFRPTGHYIPRVMYTETREGGTCYREPFIAGLHTNINQHPSIVKHTSAKSHNTRPLTPQEKRDLLIYLSGDFNEYPKLINSRLLREVVSKRLREGTKPDPDGVFL